MFGGLDDDRGLELESAFEIGFSREPFHASDVFQHGKKMVLHHSPASASAIRR